VRLGTIEIVPGCRANGYLNLGHYPDGPIESPVVVAAGKKEGPTLWVQGCVHGAEVGGPVALLRVMKGLDLERLRGTLIGLTVANPTAFRGYARNTPLDGTNLNRVFPGRPGGSHTEQLASVLLGTALEVADVLLDLHSGGDRSVVPFYALYWDDGSPASQEAARLARSAGTPNLWASRDDWLTGSMFCRFTLAGKPGLIVECGGGAQVPEEHLRSFEAAILGVMRGLEMLDGPPPGQPRYRVVRDAHLIYSTRGGLFVPAVTAGQVVQAGQELGRVMNLFGEAEEVVTAPFGPGWLASVRRAWMPVYSGDQLFELITVEQDL